jgi:hypothetical protein
MNLKSILEQVKTSVELREKATPTDPDAKNVLVEFRDHKLPALVAAKLQGLNKP